MWSALVRPTPVVLLALAAMVALRVAHLLELEAHSVLFRQPTVDALEYFDEARRRAMGSYEYAVPMHGPLFPALLGVVYALCNGTPFWLHLVTSLIGPMTVVLLYFGGRGVVGRWPAALAAVLFAFYRPGLLYECEYYAAGLANFFVLATGLLLAGWARGRGDLPRALAVGVAMGMAIITRTNLVALVPFAILLLWRARCPWRHVCVVVALALLPAGIYTARNVAVSGSWIFVQARGGQNLYMANFDGATGLVDIRPGPTFEAVRRRPMVEAGAFGLAAQDRFHLDRFLERVALDPGGFAALVARKAWISLSPIEAPSAYDNELNAQFSYLLRIPMPGFGWLLPLAVVGLLFRGARGAAITRLFVVGLAVWLTMLLVFPTGRYRYQLAGLYCLFAGCGLHTVLASFRPGRPGVWLALGGGVVLAVGGPRFEGMYPAWRAEHEQLQANAYLTQGDSSAARGHAVAAAKLDPDYAWPRFLLGAIETQAGQMQPAVEYYTQAIERLPNFPEAFENRAYIVMRLGHLEHAERGFLKAVELMPFRFQSWEFLAQIYERQGQADKVARCRREAAVARERLRSMPWAR